jgi:hypothetical protein
MNGAIAMPENKIARPGFDWGLILVGLVTLFAVVPLLGRGVPNTADTPAHLFRVVELALAWQDGIYYPRWAANMAFGYGAPHFNYAPPLPYFLTMLAHLGGLPLDEAMKWVTIIAIFLYAYGMYLFARDLLGPGPAVLSAAAYLLIPYRLREIYVQGNFGQILGLAFLPWILWGVRRLLFTPGPRPLLVVACSYAGLLLSHNISAMLCTPLIAAYAALLLLTEMVARRRPAWGGVARRCALLLAAFALALGLAAVFWLPAFAEREYIQLHGITSGFFDFRRNFLSLKELLALPEPLDYRAINPYFPPTIGAAQLLLAALALLGLLKERVRHLEIVAHTLFFAAAFVLCLFMTLPASTPVWESVPLLPLAEFPWRWLGPAVLCGAFLAGAALHLWSKSRREWAAWGMGALLLVVVLLAAPYLFPRQPFIVYPTLEAKDIVAHEVESGLVAMTSSGEFLPIWAVPQPTGSPLLRDYKAGRTPQKFDKSSLPPGASAEQKYHNAVSDRFLIVTPQPFTARLHTLYFPGWRAYLDGEEVPLKISDPGGFIEVDLPAGSHELSLRFEDTPVRTLANVLSILSLLACLGLVVLALRRPSPERESPLSLAGRGAGGEGNGLTRQQAAWIGGGLLFLLLFKTFWVEPHTSWFRLYSPPGQVLGLQHPLDVDFGAELRLLGYDLDADTARQGGVVRATLYWQAEHPLERSYSAFVHLDGGDEMETHAASDHMHPGGIPTWRWHTALYVRDEHTLALPADIPPGLYALRTGLYEQVKDYHLRLAGQQEDTLTLQTLLVRRARPLALAELPQVPRFRLGENIRLLSYKIETLPGTKQPTITLYWQTGAPLEQSYTVFVHLVGPDGLTWGQHDGIPGQGLYPTDAWGADEIVEDSHSVTLKPDAPPGDYRLAVGLYLLQSGQRLPVYDEAGRELPEGRALLPVSFRVGEP